MIIKATPTSNKVEEELEKMVEIEKKVHKPGGKTDHRKAIKTNPIRVVEPTLGGGR